MTFHTHVLRRTVSVDVPPAEAWGAVARITDLPLWVEGVRVCRIKRGCRKRRGVGAVRDVVFEDGTVIEEHVVDWIEGRSFSYVAVSGLPLRAYVATISVDGCNATRTARGGGAKKAGGAPSRITWRSYMNSGPMTAGEFGRLVKSMSGLYAVSLRSLRSLIEGR